MCPTRYWPPSARVQPSGRRCSPLRTPAWPGMGSSRGFGFYRALLDDSDLDVVYVATPHPHHRALALAALGAGKAILVEKSFTVTPAAPREIVAAAGAAGRFAMEAMWTRFCPAVVRLRELVAGGAIGEVCT